jgi:hypothetical protein
MAGPVRLAAWTKQLPLGVAVGVGVAVPPALSVKVGVGAFENLVNAEAWCGRATPSRSSEAASRTSRTYPSFVVHHNLLVVCQANYER